MEPREGIFKSLSRVVSKIFFTPGENTAENVK
jgi:hypothetical protein